MTRYTFTMAPVFVMPSLEDSAVKTNQRCLHQVVITCIWDLQAMARPKKEASEQHTIPLKVSCTELCSFCRLIFWTNQVENQVCLHINEWRSLKSITGKVAVFRCACSVVVPLVLPSLSKRRVRITATKSHIKMLLPTLKNFTVTPPRKFPRCTQTAKLWQIVTNCLKVKKCVQTIDCRMLISFEAKV